MIRPSIRWGLGATLALTALALAWPEGSTPAVALQAAPERTNLPLAQGAASPLATALPSVLPRAPIAPNARRDPFQAVLPGATTAPPAKPVAAVQTPPPAPPPMPELTMAPTAAPVPAFTHRYLGRFEDPQGGVHLFLAKGDQWVKVVAGTALADGYVVSGVGAEGITVRHAASGQTVLVRTPADAQGGTP